MVFTPASPLAAVVRATGMGGRDSVEAILSCQHDHSRSCSVRTFTAVVERDPDTGLYVGFVPGFPGAHSQAESLDELQRNLREVVALLLEDGEPRLEAEFVGIQTVAVG